MAVVLKVCNVAEWLKHCAGDQHDRGSKLTRTIPLWIWEKPFTTLSPA